MIKQEPNVPIKVESDDEDILSEDADEGSHDSVVSTTAEQEADARDREALRNVHAQYVETTATRQLVD